MTSLEQELKKTLQEVKVANFNKTNLEKFKELPRVLRPCFSSPDDKVKVLAVEVYGELLKKICEFGKQFKNGKITPNDEELKSSEELIDAIYDNNKALINTYPWITTKTRINEIQVLLPELKNKISEKRTNNPAPKSQIGIFILIVVIGGAVLILLFSMIKKKRY